MNTSHLHIDPELNVEVDAGGLREHCAVCRKKQGLKPLSETEVKLLKQAAKTATGSGSEPAEQLIADLRAQEDENDRLRGEIKAKDAEIARLTKLLEKKS